MHSLFQGSKKQSSSPAPAILRSSTHTTQEEEDHDDRHTMDDMVILEAQVEAVVTPVPNHHGTATTNSSTMMPDHEMAAAVPMMEDTPSSHYHASTIPQVGVADFSMAPPAKLEAMDNGASMMMILRRVIKTIVLMSLFGVMMAILTIVTVRGVRGGQPQQSTTSTTTRPSSAAADGTPLVTRPDAALLWQRYQPYLDELSEATTLLEVASPQAQAVDFLLHDDAALLLLEGADEPVFRAALRQRYALLVFAYATNIVYWTSSAGVEDHGSWFLQDPASHECDWYGVSCRSSSSALEDQKGNGLAAVTSIRLPTNKLVGTIPHELAKGVPLLEELVLRYNNVEGSLPDSLYQLTHLVDLDLNGNLFSSTLSPDMGQWTDLKYLTLSESQMTGSIPSSMALLTNLERLDLSQNQLQGTIMDTLVQLTNLKHLEIGHMYGITGTVPTEISQLSLLEYFFCTVCNLDPHLPTEIGLVTNLLEINFEADRLGSQEVNLIPSELGNLLQLEHLRISGKGISGPIPSEIGRLTMLKNLLIRTTSVSGAIPSELGNLSSLVGMRVFDNKLTGTIPNQLAGLGNTLRVGYFEHNRLTGTVPEGLCNRTDVHASIVVDCILECTCCTCVK